MEYTELSPDHQQQIIRGRLIQLEQEYFGHSLNIQEWEGALTDPALSKADKDAMKAQVYQSSAALNILDRKWAKTQAVMGKLAAKTVKQ